MRGKGGVRTVMRKEVKGNDKRSDYGPSDVCKEVEVMRVNLR